jgi:hypothetical protein
VELTFGHRTTVKGVSSPGAHLYLTCPDSTTTFRAGSPKRRGEGGIILTISAKAEEKLKLSGY